MKKIIGNLLILLLIMANSSYVSGGQRILMMSDIDKHWIKDYQADLYLLQHLQIFSGYSDGSFRPDNQITREEFVKILITALGPIQEKEFSRISFHDVEGDRWSHPYIEEAIERGLLQTADYQGYFRPQQPITRQEIAVLIARALQKPDATANETGFIDQDEIDAWARPFVAYAVERGIINGYEAAQGTYFGPGRTATRAEAALMITRLMEQINSLKKTGFYAIDSYKQLDTVKEFQEVAFGWSALIRNEDGKVGFTMNSRESSHRLPNGYQEPLDFALQSGVKRTLMLTEARTDLIYQLLEDQEAQNEVITAIVNSLEQYGFTGIVMDLENIRNTEKGYARAYADLLRNLKKALEPHNYQLTVAVQPRNVVGYYDGFDYKAIGEIADEVIIMAHDYYDRRSTSQLTDHAPFLKVKEALTDALKDIPKEKVILALQIAGGTQFRIDSNQSATLHTPSMSTIYRALKERKGQQSFDYQTMTPTFAFYDETTQINNKIRYEDYHSLKSKVLLAKYYGIKGVSLWRIGEIQSEMLPLFTIK
ncbi:S-layer homology domain-containing protein [Alkaliphilus crotonatoxidans]